jgi:hypothetical protein
MHPSHFPIGPRTVVGDDYCDYMVRSTETTTFNIMEVGSGTVHGMPQPTPLVTFPWIGSSWYVMTATKTKSLVPRMLANVSTMHVNAMMDFMGSTCEFEVPLCKFLGTDLDLRCHTIICWKSVCQTRWRFWVGVFCMNGTTCNNGGWCESNVT